jgi:hypothetical protein
VEKSGGCCVDVHLRARFPPIVWRPPCGKIQDRMARTRSAGAEATAAQAATPPPAPQPTNPSASATQPSAGTGEGASVPEVEHTAPGGVRSEPRGAWSFDARHRSATKDTSSYRGQGHRSPARARRSPVFVPSTAAPAAGCSTDADNCR